MVGTQPVKALENRLYVSQELTQPYVDGIKQHTRVKPMMAYSIGSKISSLRRLVWMTMLAECNLLCGDIAANPGAINFSEIQRREGLGYVIGIYFTDAKFEEISVALHMSDKRPEQKLDILILTETFCTSKVPHKYYGIGGYNLHRKDRLGKKGGSILVYAIICNHLLAHHFHTSN